MHLENILVMYGVYSAETLERLIQTVHALHSQQTMYKNLFAGKTPAAYEYYSQMHGECGIQHYAINLMLYLRTIKDKCIKIKTNLFHKYTYMQKWLEFWLKVIYQFCL